MFILGRFYNLTNSLAQPLQLLLLLVEGALLQLGLQNLFLLYLQLKLLLQLTIPGGRRSGEIMQENIRSWQKRV